jgi:hypothetical protein
MHDIFNLFLMYPSAIFCTISLTIICCLSKFEIKKQGGKVFKMYITQNQKIGKPNNLKFWEKLNQNTFVTSGFCKGSTPSWSVDFL